MPLPANQEAFIALMLPTALKYEALYGFAAEGLIGINISETNYGAAPSLFGIKGTGTAGSAWFRTWENYGPGREHTVIDDAFAVYASVDDAYAAFFTFIQVGRYIPAWNAFVQTRDWRELVRGINRAGYATDPTWADNVIIPLSARVRSSDAFQKEPPMKRFNSTAAAHEGKELRAGVPYKVALTDFSPAPVNPSLVRVEIYGTPVPGGSDPELRILDGDGSYAGQAGWGRGELDPYVQVDVIPKDGFFVLQAVAGNFVLVRVGLVATW